MRRVWLGLVLLLGCGVAMVQAQGQLIPGNRTLTGTLNYCEPTTASGTTYACALNPAMPAYRRGQLYGFRADVANTGPATINFNSLGARALVKRVNGVSTPLAADDIGLGEEVLLQYDGVSMQVLSIVGTGGGGGSITMRTEDSTVSVDSVTTIRVPNGTLVDQTGGAVSITMTGHAIQNEGVLVGSTPSTFIGVINFLGPGIDCVENSGVAIECTVTGVAAPDATDTGTKGVSTYAASDFTVSAGLVSLDYSNGQAASAAQKGFLTAADFSTFSAKVPPTRALTIAGTPNEVSSSAGAQDLLVDRTWTLSLPATLDLSTKALLGEFPLTYEGATADDFEKRLQVTDPTADRTHTITNADSVDVTASAAVANEFVTGLGADGQLTRAQPNFGNLGGTCALAQGCPAITTAPDDQVMVGNGTAWQLKALPDCDGSGLQALNYDTSTNAWSCNPVTGLTLADEGSALTARTTLNFTGAGVSCADNSGQARTDCTVSAVGTPNSGLDFTNETTVTWLGSSHGLATKDLIPVIYDTAGNTVTPGTFHRDPTTFDVTVTFASPQSGRLVLNASSTPAAGGGGLASTGSTGYVVETSAGVTAARTQTGTAGLIEITNGSGVGGNTVYTVGANVARLDTAQTFTGVKTFTSPSLGTTAMTRTYPNEATIGTTAGLLAQLTSASPATVTRAALADNTVDGVCVSGCGTTGSAQIAEAGQVSCTFENAVTAGNLVLVGTSVTGNCRDAGTAFSSGIGRTTQILGRASETGAAGSRLFDFWGPGHFGTLPFTDSAGLAGLLSDETGSSGGFVRAGSPTLITPALGAATATSLNGLTITTTTGTLAVANGKTATVSNTLTVSGTDGSNVNVGSGGVMVNTTSAQTLSNKIVLPVVTTLTDAATVTLDGGTRQGNLLTLSQNTNFANPTGTFADGQVIVVRVKSTTARTLTFASQFRGTAATPLPTTTSGGGLTDYFSFIRNDADNTFDYMPLGVGY